MARRNEITPLSEMDSRPPEAGRIRLGKKVKTKNGKEAPGKLKTLRFTSQWRDVLDELQPHVGGTVMPWNDPRASPQNQFELISTVEEVDIYIWQNGLSCWYEMWSGGGCARRCDGVDCTTVDTAGPEERMVVVPCMCRQQGIRLCEPYTRLIVVLPQVRFRGVWRLDTKGWNAQAELPGMFKLIEELNERGGMVQAVLGMVQVERATSRGKNNWVQPKLSIKQSVLELQAGMAQAQLIAGAVQTPMLGLPSAGVATTTAQPPQEHTPPLTEDDIVDADVLDDEYEEILEQLRKSGRYFNLDVDRFATAIARSVTNERDGAPCSMERQKERMHAAEHKMQTQQWIPTGFRPDGGVAWQVS